MTWLRMVRVIALLCGSGLALHELRWLPVLGATALGHGVSGAAVMVAPTIAAVVIVAFAPLLLRAARVPGCRARIRQLWPIATGALLTLYASQELLQGVFVPDHPLGLHGAFGHGGWLVVPLALLLGGLVAIAVGAARELERGRRPKASGWLVCPATARVCRPPAVPAVARLEVARHLAGRSPPPLVV